MNDSRRPQAFEGIRLPRANAPEASPGGFVLLPAASLPGDSTMQRLAHQALYQWAWVQAQGVLRPSLPERDLLAVWN